ncbi:MAG: apolipoprotein N-acyltransferase [Elusimicrobia bacterium]|nr:apolipoprotein N-acyltransferase [Elusimicrobiota bacterium]
MKKVTGILLPAATSLLLVLSYPKFDQGWLAWGALAPLAYYLLKSQTFKSAALGGLACGFLSYLGILYWIYPTMRAGGVGPLASALGLALLALLMSLEFLAVSAYGYWLKRAGLKAWPYLFAAGWFVLEYGKVLLSSKAVWFPWFMLGYTQWDYKPLIQIASVTGVYGLSAALCFTGSLAGALLARDLRPAARALRFLPAAAVFGLLFVYGRSALNAAKELRPVREVKAVLLQPSVDQYAKWDPSEEGNIEARISGLLAGAKGAELAVWPENALPCWIDDPACAAWLKKAASGSGAGASLVGSVSKGEGKHVSAYLLDSSGAITASYDKRQLVPFGEYVPLRDFLGGFVKPVAELGEFEPGAREQGLMGLSGLHIGAAICYESIFPYLFADDARAGADLFVNITNDGWYLDTAAPYQHFIVNIFRAVENRRSVARAANNGISGVIDPWGRVLAKTGLDERAALAAVVPVYDIKAFFPEHGGRLALGAALAVSAFLLALLLI